MARIEEPLTSVKLNDGARMQNHVHVATVRRLAFAPRMGFCLFFLISPSLHELAERVYVFFFAGSQLYNAEGSKAPATAHDGCKDFITAEFSHFLTPFCRRILSCCRFHIHEVVERVSSVLGVHFCILHVLSFAQHTD